MKVKTIGIVYESKDDALKAASTIVKEEHVNIDVMHHWREKEEINAVAAALNRLGYEVRLLGTPEDIVDNISIIKKQVDFIFNLSSGFRKRYRMSKLPAICEAAGIPYSGADPYTKMICQNKHLMKSFWDKLNIPTPPWAFVEDISKLKRVETSHYPLIIKPSNESNSIGINANAVAYNKDELISRVEAVYSTVNQPLIIEKFIAGREYKVFIIGNKVEKFTGMIEYLRGNGGPLNNEFIYFNAKINGDYHEVKRDISLNEYKQIKLQCEAIYDMFLPLDYGSFDIRVDENGNHYFLELNADVSLHPKKAMAKCFELNGIDYVSMIRRILKSAFERWNIEE